MPIADYTVTDVWDCLAEVPYPKSIDIYRLAEVYRHGGGECPMVRETNDKPCASARFGCWVCTVVRRDRSAENLMIAGYDHLKPFFDFRSWLVELRNNVSMRCGMRRNGSLGPGPFKLEARRMMFKRVRQLEGQIGCKLINKSEEQQIRKLWKSDQRSSSYKLLEAHCDVQ